MKIGVTSQNFRTITGHAGKTRRFLVYRETGDGTFVEDERLDLPKTMSLHEFRGSEHPIFSLDLLITAGCGEGFRRRMATHQVEVIATAESDPATAVRKFLAGETLPPAEPHVHDDESHASHEQAATAPLLANGIRLETRLQTNLPAKPETD